MEDITKSVDRHKLLFVFLHVMKKDEPNNLPYTDIQKLLIEEFNQEFSIEEIRNYYEPNYIEEATDLRQQFNNLGVRYG
jgi:hypothetical protein